MSDNATHLATTLNNRQDAIASAWHQALVPLTAREASETRPKFNEWTQQILSLLLAETFERDKAQSIGEALAAQVSDKPAVVGRTQELLAQQLSAGMTPDQLLALYPRLIEILSEIGIGFVREKEKAINSLRSKFLSSTVHDLRSPLNAVIGFSRIILKGVDGPITELQQQDLQAIFDGGQKLLNDIDTVFRIERILVDPPDFTVNDFDLRELIHSAVAAVRPLIEENENTLELRCPDSLGMMHSDAGKVKNILINLLSHAAKFTKQGVMTLAASRHTEGDAEWVRIEVADTGLGLTAEQVKRFNQANDPSVPRYSNIELMIAQRYCWLMGGRITAESQVGKGTTFTVLLPAVQREV